MVVKVTWLSAMIPSGGLLGTCEKKTALSFDAFSPSF